MSAPSTCVSPKRYPPEPSPVWAWCQIGHRPSCGHRSPSCSLLARDRRESPLDVVDEVAQLLVPAKPLVAAVALADQIAGRCVQRPLRAVAELSLRQGAARGPSPRAWARPGPEVGPTSGDRARGHWRLGHRRRRHAAVKPSRSQRDSINAHLIESVRMAKARLQYCDELVLEINSPAWLDRRAGRPSFRPRRGRPRGSPD